MRMSADTESVGRHAREKANVMTACNRSQLHPGLDDKESHNVESLQAHMLSTEYITTSPISHIVLQQLS